jgi:hypothetical protein
MFYEANTAALILKAIQAVTLANNGYADIGPSKTVADAVALAGFKVAPGKSLHGVPTFYAFTQTAAAALHTESPKQPRQFTDGPDYEGMILARQEARDYA